MLTATGFVTAAAAFNISGIRRADLLLIPTTSALCTRALFSGMAARRFPRSANEVLVFFDYASVLDERQVVRACRLFGLATPGSGRKPDSIRVFRDRLLDVSDHCIWPPEYHHHVERPTEVVEARKRRQSGYSGTVWADRNDIESHAMEIRDHLMTVPRGTWTGADDGDDARRTQHARNHRLFTCDVSHARCNELRWTYSTDSNRSDVVGKTTGALSSVLLGRRILAPSFIEALSNCAGKIRRVPLWRDGSTRSISTFGGGRSGHVDA